jgi:hypothetical protein
MLRKLLFTAIIGTGLTLTASAEVYVRVAPPPPIIEHRIPPPGREYIWTPGYYRWDGRVYVWVPGVWVLPPHHRAHWVPAHWVHRRGGWVFVEGHWR